MDKDLRAVLHLKDPSRRVERLLRAFARAYLPLTASAAAPIGLVPISGFWGWLAISARGVRRARAMSASITERG
jgi:hypothetical protein